MAVRPNATINGSRSATATRMNRYGIPQHTLKWVTNSTHSATRHNPGLPYGHLHGQTAGTRAAPLTPRNACHDCRSSITASQSSEAGLEAEPDQCRSHESPRSAIWDIVKGWYC